jgi:hypothetical protein
LWSLVRRKSEYKQCTLPTGRDKRPLLREDR